MNSEGNLATHSSGVQPLNLPPRSHLYCLEPVGLTAGEPESATSYVSRLAIAHSVSTWSLLKIEIAPSLFGPEAIIRNRLSELLAAMGSACNGENKTSRRFISILNSLTAREDLSGTTMSFCKGFVCSRFLVRVEQTWCSLCLEEWKGEGREIHWPLLWHVMAAKVCPRHRIPLRTDCPACGQKFHPMVARSRPGFCHRCRRWLGSSISKPAFTPSECEADHEIAQTISDFLRDGPTALQSVKRSLFPENIDTLVKCLFEENLQALVRYLGINRSSIIAWKTGVQRPTLLSLAEVSHRFKVSPVALLSRELRPEEFTLQACSSNRLVPKRFPTPPKSDLEQMRKVLEEAVNDDSVQCPSLSKLAARLGCRQTTLNRRFPELASKIKERHQKFCDIRKEVRVKLFRSLVHDVVIRIHKAGNYPSQWRVRQALPSFVDMREPAAYDEWKRMLVELELVECSANVEEKSDSFSKS
jgi:transcriptional regulator with XRE-family HTH domain